MRRVIGRVLLVVAAQACTPAVAQEFPEREIRIFCGFPAGSSADIWVRHFAEKMRAFAGKPVIVENKSGAGGNLAVEAVTHAKPDGHTIVISTGGPASYNVHLFKRLGYDPAVDLTPVSSLVNFPFVLIVNPKSNISSVKDLVAAMKAKGAKASYGAVGGTPIVLTELLKHHSAFDAVQVMYRDSNAILNDLASGTIDFVFMDSASALAQAREGRVRALAVSTPQRSSAAPELPTMAEAGFPGIDRMAWFAMLMPGNTPPKIAKTVNEWIQKILATDDTKAFFRNSGADVFPSTPEQLRKLQQDEIAKWAELVKLAKMEPQ